DSSGSTAPRTRPAGGLPDAVAVHRGPRQPVHVWHRAGVAPPHRRTRADDFHQSVRHDLLLARRPARVSRHGRSGDARRRVGAGRCGTCARHSRRAHRRTVAVLAFRRRRVGGGVHRRVRHRTLSAVMPREETTIEVPAPTAWPFVLATGFTLIFAGLL